MSTNVDYRLLEHWSASQRAYGAARAAVLRRRPPGAAGSIHRDSVAAVSPAPPTLLDPDGRGVRMPLEDR